MAEIHHRMPVIIDSKDAEQWLLSENPNDVDQLMQAKPDWYNRILVLITIVLDQHHKNDLVAHISQVVSSSSV